MDPVEKPKLRHSDRPPAAVVAARTEDILPLVVDGASRHEIIAWVRKHSTWNDVTDRTIDSYMARAWRLIRTRSENSAQHYTDEAIARYQRLFRRASDADELNVARMTEDSLVKLLGLAAPERWHVAIDDLEAQLKRALAED